MGINTKASVNNLVEYILYKVIQALTAFLKKDYFSIFCIIWGTGYDVVYYRVPLKQTQ